MKPSLETIIKLGGETEKGKKKLSLTDIYPIYKACRNVKDQREFNEFTEIINLYDITRENTIFGAELLEILSEFGKKLTKEDFNTLVEELSEPEEKSNCTPLLNIIRRRSSLREI